MLNNLGKLMPLVVVLGFGVHQSALGWATISPTRLKIQNNYVAAQQDAWNLFSGTPTAHIIPQRGKATVALGGDYLKAIAVDDGTTVAEATEFNSKLTLGGYKISPLVVLQDSRFGMGFGATVGKRTSEYYESRYTTQSSEASFSGLNLATYFIPKFPFVPNNVTTSFLVGAERVYVTHETKDSRPLDIPAFTLENKARYSVTTLNVGADVGILLSNRFTVMPWFDFKKIWSVSPNATSDSSEFETNNILVADESVFFRSEYRYGLDLSVKVQRFTLHFGGALGFLAGIAKGSDNVRDSSLSGGFSVDL